MASTAQISTRLADTKKHGMITREMIEAEQKRMTPAYAKKVLMELKLITKNGNPTARYR